MSSNAGPSSPKKISGTVPGLLDPSQAQRLLRLPGSRLLFASFDPRTASAPDVPDLHKLSLSEELYRPKRVVIEMASTGESFWRFVPSAQREGGVLNEGEWPRVVQLCGELVEVSQDQWDIYKLDPHYDCCVRTPDNLTVISHALPKPKLASESPSGKRRIFSPSPERVMPRPNPRKKDEEEDDEEGEVEEMIVDGQRPRQRSAGPNGRARKFKEEIERNRKERREKLARRAERLARQEDFDFNSSGDVPPVWSAPQEPPGKRKVTSLFDPLRSHNDPDYSNHLDEDSSHNSTYVSADRTKRTRTVSPSAAKRDLEAKRLERERQKNQRREQELNHRREQRNHRFMSEVYAEVPPFDGSTQSYVREATADIADNEAARQAAIEESRRKLAELEADRPIWEEAAKRRAMSEVIDEDARYRDAEAKRLQAEAAKRVKAEQILDKNEKKEPGESGKNDRDNKDGLTDLGQHNARLSVPWPVLQSPVSFSVEDVDWTAVEQFFEAVRPHMRSQDYKIFVEKSHRRFHPDRWRSRSILKTVVDEAERGCMEVGVNTTLAALTGR
ncbi:hypothetical protein BD779DRAFT_1467705 [Infundibulicybe gibba]|nr:hypothetical protein BD779DRAFT_1467705 [Infundibulicybe gibba]